MSQVIVVDDILKTRRQKSAEQEHRIKTDSGLAKWQRSDVVGFDPVKTAVGFAVLPIVGLWGLILGALGFAFGVAASIFRLAGKIIR